MDLSGPFGWAQGGRLKNEESNKVVIMQMNRKKY
jgi:hypothetical protein